MVRQRRPNRKKTVEGPVKFKAGGRGAFDLQGTEAIGQTLNHTSPICGTIGSILLEFRDVKAEQPISDDEVGICSADGSRAEFLVGAMAKVNELVEVHAA